MPFLIGDTMAKPTKLVLKKTFVDPRKHHCYQVIDKTGNTLGFVASEGKGSHKRWGFTLTASGFKGIILYPHLTRKVAVEKLVQFRSVKADTNSITIIK